MVHFVTQRVHFTSIELRNFKAFRHFSVRLENMNVLVEPNNSGKSTILGAFRALDAALRRARSRKPERVQFADRNLLGYQIPPEVLTISTENIHTDLADTDTSVSFRLSNGNRLRLVFPVSGGCSLIPESDGSINIFNTG